MCCFRATRSSVPLRALVQRLDALHGGTRSMRSRPSFAPQKATRFPPRPSSECDPPADGTSCVLHAVASRQHGERSLLACEPSHFFFHRATSANLHLLVACSRYRLSSAGLLAPSSWSEIARNHHKYCETFFAGHERRKRLLPHFPHISACEDSARRQGSWFHRRRRNTAPS